MIAGLPVVYRSVNMWSVIGLCVLLLALKGALTEDKVTPVFFTEGGSLTLEIRPAFPERITNILWKFNGNLLAVWVEDVVDFVYYKTFKGRTTLAADTGRLTVNNMTKADQGVYSVTVNNKVHNETYEAVLIKKVTKPKVRIRTLTCSAISHTCNVTCDADTSGAEPVTYSWKMGVGDWKVWNKDIAITKTDHAQAETLTCRIHNPVSGETSDPEPNKLYQKHKPDNGHVVGGVVGGLVGVVGVGVGVYLTVAWIKKMFPFSKRGTTSLDSADGKEGAQTPSEAVPFKDRTQDSKSDTKDIP